MAILAMIPLTDSLLSVHPSQAQKPSTPIPHGLEAHATAMRHGLEFFATPAEDTIEPRMPDSPHDDAPSRGYDKDIVDRVWRFGQTVRGNDDALWRKDEFGAWIHRLDFGNRNSSFGWEIADFGTGESGGGVATLRPCQWQNYLEQGSARTRSRISADGLRNVRVLL